jgi:zinc protease
MFGRTSLVCLVALSGLLEARTEGFAEIKSLNGITEYRLESNGLTVLLRPEHSVPAVTFMVTYRIGSRNESYGTTGATHLLEHLMFKGTARHNKEAGNGFDQLLERTGAETNATTWLDRTNYITTLGPQDLPVIVGLEADRMRNLRLREEDRRPEMTVVRNEFDQVENNPMYSLQREIWATAYLAHPYRHSTLGWSSDVENVPIEKLREFYDTYYWPDNATVSVIGDFQPDTVLPLIKQHYAEIPKSPKAFPQVYTREPAQTGPRRVEMKRPGELGVVTRAYKSPPATDPDYAPLAVLCELLGEGKNSRFRKTLTDAGMTTEVMAGSEFTRDPSLLSITAELTGEAGHAEVEQRIIETIATLLDKGVSDEEVASAIARLDARSTFDRDGSSQIAFALNECIAVGDWTLYHTLNEAVRQVTAAEVNRVARRWLVKDRSTTGWFVPQARDAEPEEAPAVPEALASTPSPPLILPEGPPATVGEAARIAPRISRSRTAGLDLLLCPTGTQDLVILSGSIPFDDPAQQALASFTARLLDRGTSKHDVTQIGTLLDEVGATLEFGVREDSIEFAGRCMKKDLPRVLDLLAGQLREPSFPPEEIEKVRTQMLAETAQSRSDTNSQALLAFSRAAFPDSHPKWEAGADETITRLKTLQREDLVRFHRDWIGPAGATLVLAGDLDLPVCRKEVAEAFAGWVGGKVAQAPASPPPLAAAVELKVPIPGKESVSLILGQPSGLRFGDPDYLPLALATSALGQGFTSRLLNTVRDTEGLTYGVQAQLSSRALEDGTWLIAGSFAPDLLERGLGSVRRELGKWHREGLGPVEFAYHQNAMIGRHRVSLATTENLAAVVLATARRGLPLSWLDEFPAQVAALSPDQVNEVIRRRLDPARMITVKSGKLP